MENAKYGSLSELKEALSLDEVNVADASREVDGGYCGDLLSWVMGRAPADSAWITVMGNINVIAVASLADVACVIIAEGATLDPDALEAAKKKEINVFASKKTIFELARML